MKINRDLKLNDKIHNSIFYENNNYIFRPYKSNTDEIIQIALLFYIIRHIYTYLSQIEYYIFLLNLLN